MAARFRKHETPKATRRSRLLWSHKISSVPSVSLRPPPSPELQQSKTAVLTTLASRHSRRSYEYAIERFIAWYCSEPRLEFNRSVEVRYRSFLERLSLSAATINLQPIPEAR